MSDLKKDKDNPTLKKPVVDLPKTESVMVTQENFGPVSVHYLQLIYGRLGYIIKLLEKQPEVK